MALDKTPVPIAGTQREYMNNISPSPALTVAMSVYNGERFLVPAIESILAQTFTDFEFLIVDDGSSDKSAAIIESYAARDARIRPIIRENHGLIVSLNQMLAEARAPIIARMDADDISRQDRFEKQMAFLAANPDHGIVGSWSTDIDENDEPWTVDAPEHPVTHAEFEHNIRYGGPLLCHPVVMFRADIVRQAGGYHAAFKHCEDHDLWLRLASVTKMANIPERLIRYRHYPEQVSKRHATEQQIGAAVAYEAWRARDEGREDPTEKLDRLPPLDEMDALFGKEGVARKIRAHVTRGILHSPTGLRDAGFDIILAHIRDGGDRAGLWRATGRLLKYGDPARAVRLFATLATS